MKRFALTIFLCAAACATLAELVPELLTANWYRTNVVTSAALPTLYKGSTLRFTNCHAFVLGTATQNLTDVTVIARIGDTATNLSAVLTVTDAANGIFNGDAQIPATGGTAMRIQLRMTNSGNVMFIYPALSITVQAPL